MNDTLMNDTAVPVPDPTRVVVVLPESLDWSVADQMLATHLASAYVPVPVYPVHSGGLARLRDRGGQQLLDVVRRPAGSFAAGGPLSRLSLRRLAHTTHAQARQRWWTWNTLVARTPVARDWSSFHAQTSAPARAISLDEARRRFEAQPRVLTMIAFNGRCAPASRLDVQELAAFQAGEDVYATLAWQQALVGQALVVPGGVAYRPVTDSLADHLRYLQAALAVVHALTPDRRLVATARVA